MEQANKRQIRVLIFDDDEPIRNLLSRVAEMRGYEAVAFEDPSLCPLYTREKCTCIDDEACADIILCDIKMPTVNGMDFIEQQLAKACRIGEMNIALISGYWSPDLKARAAKYQVKTFVKPFSIGELSAWMEGCETRINLNAKLIEL